MRFLRAIVVLPLFVPVLSPALHAQSVISVRSGLINYSDGAVIVDNQPVVNRSGRYASLKDGSELITQDGRAELLLTPSAYLRVGQYSGVRLVSGNLSDTQVELLDGSAMLDSANALPGAPITLIVRNARIRIEEPSRLRIDADPPQLKVYKGKVEVLGGDSQTEVLADQIYPLDGSSVAQKMTDGADDLLDIWSQQRNRLIYFNLASSQNIADPQDAGPDNSGAIYADGAYGSGSTGLSGWPGYMPLATVPPLTSNLYLNPYIGAYYGYTPYPYGIYGTAYPFGYGPIGYSSVRYISGYRFSPVYSGGIYPYRGVSLRPLSPGYAGGTIGSRPLMLPRPSMAPRVTPMRGAAHR